MNKAIQIYLEILQKFPEDRPAAAKTLYHLGLANEKLGRNKAVEYFNRLINTYPEQSEWAALARKKIKSSENKNVFTDSRDGHKYQYVTIGEQTWMAENLAYIPHVNPKMKGENGIWVYDYDGWDVEAAKATKNYETYGCLYDWPSAMGLDSTWLVKTWTGDPINNQGICPPDWHLPTDEEWKELESFLGMPEAALNDIKYLRSGISEYFSNLPEYPPVGKFLKAVYGWSGVGIGDNHSGFNAIPAGTRRESPPFYYSGLGNWAYFWSATVAYVNPASYPSDQHEQTAWSRELPGNSEDDYRMFSSFNYGQSVRCVKNQVGNISESSNRHRIDQRYTSLTRAEYQSGHQTTTSSANWSNRIGANSNHTGFVSGSAPRQAPEILWSVNKIKSYNGSVIANGMVFVSSNDSSLYAFDAETGREIWRIKVDAQFVTLHEIADSILIASARMSRFNPRSGFIIMIDPNSGKILWQSEPGPAIWCVTISDGLILYSRSDSCIVAADFRTKEIIWKKKIPHGGSRVSFFPNNKGILVIASTMTNSSGTQLHVKPNYVTAWDIKTGLEKWEFSTMMSILSTPAIYGNRVFFGCTDRNFYSIDLTTGLKAWRFYTGNKITGSSAVAYDIVFFGGRDDNLYALDASSGRLIWKKDYISSSTGLQPVIADNLIIYYGADSCLYANDAFTGKNLWKYKLNKALRAYPMIYNGRLYFVSDETLYALE